VFAAAAACVAAVIDLRTRRVPNWLTGVMAAGGVATAAAGIGYVGVIASLSGLALGAALMLPGHVLGGTGAGDVKLLAAAGAVIGPAATLKAFVITVLAGGVMALMVAFQRGRLRHTLATTVRLAGGQAVTTEIEDPQADNRFAYAPAIAIGVVLAVLELN
jgi:prepilin peptidase CpaA